VNCCPSGTAYVSVITAYAEEMRTALPLSKLCNEHLGNLQFLLIYLGFETNKKCEND
jgi:hypothetical protein